MIRPPIAHLFLLTYVKCVLCISPARGNGVVYRPFPRETGAYRLQTILSRPLARAPRVPKDSTAIPAALLLSLKISITCAFCTVSNVLVLNEVLLYCKHLNLFISTTSEEWHSKVYLNKTSFSHSPGWLKLFTPRYF